MSDDSVANDVLSTSAQGRLRSFVERALRLEEDKAAVSADLKELFAEAKGEGFSVPILRKVIKRLKMDKAKLQEELAMIDLYEGAISGQLFDDTKVTLSTGGETLYEGTVGGMKRAAERLNA